MSARSRPGTRALSALVAAALAVLVVLVGPNPALAMHTPDFQMPFACGERWEASTRSTHSPSALSVDWNRDSHDLGHPVVADAPGVVTSVVNLGDQSYGRYVVVDHGGRWSTLHAHLLRSFVTVGQRVDQGQVIARLGNSGGSTGPHLHYEQRFDRTDRHAVFDGVTLRYNSWVRSRNCTDVPVVGDWNGDRRSDVGVFARHRAAGVYRERLPDGTRYAASFGKPTDQPVVGDWDGNGQTDLGAYDAMTATFTLQTSRGGERSFAFGSPGNQPIAGDWDGDGRTDVGVFRPSTHTFVLRAANGTFSTRVLGTTSSLPVVGDWDGDGRFEIGVYDPAIKTFTLALASGGTESVRYGTRTSLPAVGFWTRDTITDLGVWDRRTATFSKRLGPHRTSTVTFGRPR